MENILARIVASKKKWVAEHKIVFPLSDFIDKISPSDRDFYQALSEKKTQFILECKKASPSKGLIRKHFDLKNITKVYAKHAAAISVLTDELYFQGSFEFLPIVRSCTNTPILCKDFFIDPYQIYLARFYQADAILLMLSVLDDEQYHRLSRLALTLDLNVLTEVSNEEELKRAIDLKANIIGINNRNLRDLSICLNSTKQLAPLIPKNTLIISESGINTHQQVRELAPYVNGFLIGSALMAQDNLEQAVRCILYGDNKICGLTQPQDAKAAFDANANYGGLIFVKKSPRCIDIATAQHIIKAAPLNYVGVFQNHELSDIAATVKILKLYAVQLHGNENSDYITALRQLLPDKVQIWKAYPIEQNIPNLENNIDRHLFDSSNQGQFGGTGHVFDWTYIADNQKEHVMIAGGLNLQNAKQAAELGCLGLDFNSGVESSPGIKDKQKIDAVFAALRDY